MKRANTFLIMQYISLMGIIAVPIITASFFSQEIKRFLPGLGCILLILLTALIIIATLITEMSCVRNASAKSEMKTLFKVWKRLKLLTIPFYIINFIAYFILAPMTFPISLAIFPLDGLMCSIMIIISGICGINSIKAIKKNGRNVKGIHYIFQLLPVLDVFSTIALIKKTKGNAEIEH